MAKCSTRCLRVGLVLSSAIFLIVGDVIIGSGIYFALYDSQPAIKQLRQTLPREFVVFQVTLIALGSVTVLVSFCACVGVVLRNRCALMLYTALTGLLVLCCAALAISLVVAPALRNAALTEVERGLRRSYGNSSLVTSAVDTVQSRMQCCGWRLHTDVDAPAAGKCGWFAGTAWHRSDCPQSCCTNGAPSCGFEAAQKTSCFEALNKYLIAAPVTLLCGMILSFLHMLCALVLTMRLPKERISAI